MDLQQIWNDVIQSFVESENDESKKALIQLLSTQCTFTIKDNNVCFLCQNDIAYKVIKLYAFDFHDLIKRMLGNNSLAMNIMMASDFVGNNSNNQNYTQGIQAQVNPQNSFATTPVATQNTVEFNNPTYAEASAATVQKQVSSFKDYGNINPTKTFENYVTDPENQLVYAIAQSIANNPGTDYYNRFYIYGGSGLGKTHLLWAIAN